jgi:Zn-dependent M28 family amino/carboxypeptidase
VRPRVLVVLIAWGAVGCAAFTAPEVVFDGGRAYEHVRQLVAIGPRPPGSPGIEATRQYLKKQFAALSIPVEEQRFDAATPLGTFPMVNVIARIPGASRDRIIFAGHYDTKLFREFRFVGANDAGSSTAFLLELARVLKARKNAFTIELLFFDGEEALRPEWADPDHTYGSRHYVDAARREGTLKQIRTLILVDMIGDRSLDIRRETESTPWLTDIIWASAARLKQTAFLDENLEVADDHVAFLRAGVPAVDVIDMNYEPYWHTPADTLDKVSARSLQAVGDVILDALPRIEARLARPGAP